MLCNIKSVEPDERHLRSKGFLYGYRMYTFGVCFGVYLAMVIIGAQYENAKNCPGSTLLIMTVIGSLGLVAPLAALGLTQWYQYMTAKTGRCEMDVCSRLKLRCGMVVYYGLKLIFVLTELGVRIWGCIELFGEILPIFARFDIVE